MKVLFIYIFGIVFAVYKVLFPNTSLSETAWTPTPAAEEETVIEAAATATEEIQEMIVHSVPTVAPEEVPTAAPLVDFKTIYGEPQVSETFEKGSTAFGIQPGLNEDEALRMTTAVGEPLSLEPKKNNGWLTWRLCPPLLSSGAVEMEFSFIQCAYGDRTGLLLHSPNYDEGKGYYISLTCEGTLSVMRDSLLLISKNVHEIYKNNSGDINKIGAIFENNQIKVYLNGTEVFTLNENAYPEGYNGFFVSPQGQDTLKMKVHAFNIYASH